MKVYLVDDDSEEAELFSEAVASVHPTVEVVWHDDVMEALECLRKEEKQPMLFLDLNIPKVSGKDMLKLLRENVTTSGTPVIIYSTSISARDIEDTSPYNVTAYLQKPEDFESLCSRLEALIGVQL